MRALAAAVILLAAACSKPTELASDGGAADPSPPAPAGAKIDPPPSPAIDPDDPKASFPDYKPKETPDTVADLRPDVAGTISALPSAAPALAQAFLDWKAKAAASPGAYEAGAIMLGADERQYVPSDAELIAAAAGDKLAALLPAADEAARAEAEQILVTAPDGRAYQRFNFRHSDVMGSGRYFYASAPVPARIPG